KKVSNFPKNTKQFYNHKSIFIKNELHKKDFIKTRDNFVDAIFNMKKSDYDNLITVCFKDQQLFDLVRFGSFEKYYSVINFDTTYNLGDFYVSYFTYRNLSLNINGTDQHPIFMGPLMVHLKKDFDCYYYFTEQVKYYMKERKALLQATAK
ncbi:Mediator of RNA polymerase II transcription subunit 15, partial [Brachionus plicatilis]